MRRAPALLLVLGLLVPESGQGQAPEDPRKACLAAVELHVRRQHMEPGQIDRGALCDTFAEKAAVGLPPQFLSRWLTSELRKAEFHYAPLGARHRPGTRYRWPFEAWIPRLVTQSDAGPTHSTPEERFAIDFLMPIGTPVLAARDGRVVDVRDGTPEGASWEQDGGNAVVILHEDGTFALYGHLREGIPVAEGQEVAAGDPIAFSGNTGYSFTPHLHFVVRRAEAPGTIRSVPVRFGRRSDRGIMPTPGNHWGNVPNARRELRVLVDGEPFSAEAPPARPYGAEVALRVELLGSDGSATDVTSSERTRYETMTLWSLHAFAPGRVRIEAVPGISDRYMAKAMQVLDQSRAQLFVYHGEPRDPDFGVAAVSFRVETAAPAP